LTLLSSWLCSEVCDIVGNEVPNTLFTESAAVGNATAAASLSVAEAESLENAVNELLDVICGNPKDIGTSDAPAWSAIKARTTPTVAVMMIIFFIVLPSSIRQGTNDVN
jgi:hypothetical protein